MDPKSNQYRAGITVIDTDAQASQLLDFLNKHDGVVGIDTETEGVDPREQSPVNNGKVVCWSLAYESEHRHDIWGTPLAHRVFLWAKHLGMFQQYLENHEKAKVGHNVFTFDRHVLRRSGISLNGIVGDTLRMSKLLRSDKRVDHSLKGLMYMQFGYKLGNYKELFTRPGRLKSKFTKTKPKKNQLTWDIEDEGKYTWRKIQGKKVRTWVADGEHMRFSYAAGSREMIPLSTMERDYPQLIPMLHDYATLDAKATLELYWWFKKRMQQENACDCG